MKTRYFVRDSFRISLDEVPEGAVVELGVMQYYRCSYEVELDSLNETVQNTKRNDTKGNDQ